MQSPGSFEPECALGQGLAYEALAYMRQHGRDSPTLLFNVVREMLRRGTWSGIEIGFMQVIGAAVVGRA